MSLMNKSRNKLDEVKIKSMGEILGDVLKATSGTISAEGGDFNVIFNKIVGFRGVRDGLGTSLFVSNLALALANRGLKICVVDTAMLYPVQDTYLKTKIKQVGAQQDEVRDWFDLQYSDKDVLNISITDNGCGMSPEILAWINSPEPEKRDGHLGLYNIMRILKLYYGNEYGLKAEVTEDGTTVTLRLPDVRSGSFGAERP